MVCLSVTIANVAKMTEQTEMPFGLWTSVGPRNHVLDGESRSPHGKRGKGRAIVKYIEYCPHAAGMWPFLNLV